LGSSERVGTHCPRQKTPKRQCSTSADELTAVQIGAIRRDLGRTNVLGPANDHRDPLVGLHATGFGFVQNEAFKWIDVARPRRLGEYFRRIRVARFPTEPNSAGTEVDIL